MKKTITQDSVATRLLNTIKIMLDIEPSNHDKAIVKKEPKAKAKRRKILVDELYEIYEASLDNDLPMSAVKTQIKKAVKKAFNVK